MPIRGIIAQAEADGLMEGVRSLRFVSQIRPWIPTHPKLEIDWAMSYQDIQRRYGVHTDDDLETDLVNLHQCRCAGQGEATIFLPLFYTNLRAAAPEVAHVEETTRRCVALLKQGCSRVSEMMFEGKTIGIAGVGRISGR